MNEDQEFEAAVREYAAGCLRALDRGDAASASAELVQALQYCFTIVQQSAESDPPSYRRAWERVARELSMLPPSLLRQAARIMDQRFP